MACLSLSCILFWIVLIIIAFKVYLKLIIGWCRSNVCLVGKTAIVTGANTGIGYFTAEDFAKRGARVILACRDETRGQEALEKIVKATDNKNVVLKKLDLSSFKSIREFVKDIKANEERLDILVNNAGVMDGGEKKTEDGLSLLMQSNYFGPFLLTTLLLDFIKKTPGARIVNVSSVAAKIMKNFDVNNLNVHTGEKVFLLLDEMYCRSKLCNVLFTIELAEKLRGSSVTTYSLHPGAVKTDIGRRLTGFLKGLLEFTMQPFAKSAMEGAQTTIYCSVEKGIEPLSGEHFEDCHMIAKYKTASDPELPKQLWKITEKIVKSATD